MRSLSVLMLLCVTFLISCEKDQITREVVDYQQSFQEPPGNVKLISGTEIPDVVELFTPSESGSNFIEFTHLPHGLTGVDTNRIMELYIQELDIYRYTFIATKNTPKDDEFYNIVISKNNQGEFSEPVLIKYEMESDFAEAFNAGTTSFIHFQGKIKNYSLQSSRYEIATRCTDICDEVTFSGGGSGSGNTSGNDPGGVSVVDQDCTYTFREVVCSCAGHSVGNSCTCDRDGGSGPYIYAEVVCSEVVFETFCEYDCPPIETNVINFPDLNGYVSTGILNEIDCGPVNVIMDDSFINCSKARCVFEELNNSGNSLFCSTIGNFIGSGIHDLRFVIVQNEGARFGIPGSTSPPDINGQITIKLNELNCETEHPLNVAGTILHEGIHAEMFRRTLEESMSPLSSQSYSTIWNTNLEIRFPGIEPPYSQAQHEIMAKEYVDDIALSLKSFDNNRYNIDYYKYIAWVGLSKYGHFLGFVTQYIDEYYDEYQIVISTNTTSCQ